MAFYSPDSPLPTSPSSSTADSLSEIIPTALNPPASLGSVMGRQQPKGRRTGGLRPPPPLSLRSVEGRQQPKERRPVKIRSVKPKVRRSPLLDLLGEEKPSFDLSDASYGPSQPEEDLLGEKPSSDLADTSYAPSQSQHKEVRKPLDTNHVLAWRDPYLSTPVFVRMDRSGFFHTYPNLGAPLRSLDEVQNAVISYAGDSNLPEDLPRKERAIRKCLFWPDKTSKMSTRVQRAKREHEKIERLVNALLDKQNDDQDRVDELKDIVHWQSIHESGGKWYYHLNVTVKTKGAADDAGSANLFFVEVARDRNSMIGYFINTFFMVNTDSKGDEVICHGCMNNGSTDMKHAPAGSFKGGLEDIRFPPSFGPCNEKQWLDSNCSEDQDLKRIKDEESRIRKAFDYLDDPVCLENLRKGRLHNCPY